MGLVVMSGSPAQGRLSIKIQDGSEYRVTYTDRTEVPADWMLKGPLSYAASCTCRVRGRIKGREIEAIRIEKIEE